MDCPEDEREHMHSCRWRGKESRWGGERADGEGREQMGRGESRWRGERADGEGREQMGRVESRWRGERADGEGREQMGSRESRRGGERADGEGREQMERGIALERCGIFALIFDVHMNLLAVAWLC